MSRPFPSPKSIHLTVVSKCLPVLHRLTFALAPFVGLRIRMPSAYTCQAHTPAPALAIELLGKVVNEIDYSLAALCAKYSRFSLFCVRAMIHLGVFFHAVNIKTLMNVRFCYKGLFKPILRANVDS